MIEAIAILLVYQLIGETLAFSFGLPIPGPVIGMALLLVTLAPATRAAREDQADRRARCCRTCRCCSCRPASA